MAFYQQRWRESTVDFEASPTRGHYFWLVENVKESLAPERECECYPEPLSVSLGQLGRGGADCLRWIRGTTTASARADARCSLCEL